MPTCLTCQSPFKISHEDEALLKKVEFRFGECTVTAPLPVHCPTCRMQLRVSQRNERFLYRNTSALSGSSILSIYHPEPLWGVPIAIYAEEEWRSDAWDPLSYGREFDLSQSFFDQWAALNKAVPRIGVINLANENSEFVTSTAYSKNCYLVNSTEYSEDCMYGKLYQRCKNCIDCSYLLDGELCYECFNTVKSYGCTYLENSQDCQDCHFSANLRSCAHCFLCTNLHRKEYCLQNQQLAKDEWERRVAEYRGSSAKTADALGVFEEEKRRMTNRHAQITNAEDCTGDCIEHSQKCRECYDVSNGQDCAYVQTGVGAKDCIDCSNVYGAELCAYTLGALNSQMLAFCLFVFNSQRMLYCEHCTQCQDCFGCVGLTQKKFCIFNRQYTKEQYETLMPKIIDALKKDGSFGQFFPASLSPFGYNESVAQEYLPLTKEEALAKGFYWRELKDDPPTVAKVIPADKLPDGIDAIPDDILNWAIHCEKTGRPYRITKQELQFYRQMRLPVPHLHPDIRYDRRARLHNRRQLFPRACAACGKAMQTPWSPDRKEKIVCGECYLKEVY